MAKHTIIIVNVLDGFGNGSFDLWKYNLREKVILSEDLVSGGLEALALGPAMVFLLFLSDPSPIIV